MIVNNRNFILASLVITVIIISVFMVVSTDDTFPETIVDYPVNDLYFQEGKRLSQVYCTSCHIYPEPDLLPGNTWVNETLPFKGPMLGINYHNGNFYPVERTPGLPENYYPPEPLLSQQEWQSILDYYETVAPKSLTRQKEVPDIIKDSLFFKSRIPEYRSSTMPMVTSLRFDPGNQLIYLSDSNDETLHVFDSNLELVASFNTPAISDIQILNELDTSGLRDLLFTYIGDLHPSDALNGSVVYGWYDPLNLNLDTGSIVIDNLVRPVESLDADLNRNGNNDMIISEFGHRTGKLTWLENMGKEEDTVKRALIDTPGCIQSHVTDYTNNGLPDIVALCTQIDQAIYLFRNLGESSFEKMRLLQFHIAAGSSSFELHDFNGNGHLDILYTSGDNADFSQIFKPYHGVYIYLNDGNDNFTKEWFYPINGAYHAKARDFTGDDNLDIAVISFFADYDHLPEESFIFFKNEGGLTFTPYHHPSAIVGRWIRMDVADWTGNGYDDILLGNFSMSPARVKPTLQNVFTQGPHFLLLENTYDTWEP